LAAVLAVGLLACAGSKESELPTLDPDAPAFRLGERVATVGELNLKYNAFVSMMAQYGMPAPSTEEEIAEYLDMMLEELLGNLSILWQADEMGVSLSAAEMAEIDVVIDMHRQEILNEYKVNAMHAAGGDETTADPADFEEEALLAIDADIQAYYGDENMTFDSYLADYRKDLESQALTEAVRAVALEGATVADEEVQAWYDSELERHKEALAEAPIDYRTFLAQYDSGEIDVPPLYVPEGFARIALITVASEEAIDESYATNRATMAALEAEYGKLMLAGGTDRERLAEIRSEYAALKAETEAVYEAFSEGPKARAEEAYAMLTEEEADFDVVAGKFNKDEATDVRLLYQKERDDSVPEAVWTAAGELEPGAHSAILEVEGTFYIVKLVERLREGPVPLRDVKEQATAAALIERQEVVWKQRQADWLEEAREVVVRYEANYAMIGR